MINTVTEKENQSFFNLFPKIMVEDGISLYCLLLQWSHKNTKEIDTLVKILFLLSIMIINTMRILAVL